MIFDYKLTMDHGISSFALSGELVSKEQALKMLEAVDAGIEKGDNKILLDLSDLKYVNSSGLNVMINILTKARKSGGDVAICNVNKKINELLVITKLNSVFNVSDSVDKAKAVLSK